MKSIGEKIQYLRDERDKTQKELADILGIERSTIASWETDRRMPGRIPLEKMAEYFGVSIDYLLGKTDDPSRITINSIVDKQSKDIPLTDEEEEMLKKITGVSKDMLKLVANSSDSSANHPVSFPLTLDSVFMVPVYGRVAAGFPTTANQEIEETEPMDTQYLKKFGNNPKEFFFLKVKGDSMSPTIPNGSLVLVHSQPVIEPNQIACVLVNGDESTLKRVTMSGKHIVLISDNPDYPPQIYSANDCRVIGRVIRAIQNF